MENEQKSQQQSGFKALMRDIIIPKVEGISAILLLLGIILKYLDFGFPQNIVAVSLTSLAITSYLLAFLIITEGY